MSNPWFRMYHEFANDPKVQRLSEADQRRYIMLLCMRCSNGDVALHDEDVTFTLRITQEEWSKTKAVLQDKNLIDNDNKPIAWDRRQYKSDSSAERVARHRENKKNSVTLQKQQGNAIEQNRTEQIRTEHSTTRAGALCKQLRQIGIEAAPHQPQLLEMLNKHTDEQIMAVAEIAVKRKPGERVSIGYLAPMLADAGKPVKKTPPPEDFSKRDYGKGIVNL